jgi:hypothetical protein
VERVENGKVTARRVVGKLMLPAMDHVYNPVLKVEVMKALFSPSGVSYRKII